MKNRACFKARSQEQAKIHISGYCRPIFLLAILPVGHYQA